MYAAKYSRLKKKIVKNVKNIVGMAKMVIVVVRGQNIQEIIS